MCHPATCERKCPERAHALGVDYAAAAVLAACCCDPLADDLAALIAAGVPQREASLRLWGGAA